MIFDWGFRVELQFNFDGICLAQLHQVIEWFISGRAERLLGALPGDCGIIKSLRMDLGNSHVFRPRKGPAGPRFIIPQSTASQVIPSYLLILTF